jgi:hypothetical protein
VNAGEEAQWFLGQLREQTQAALGPPPAVKDLLTNRLTGYSTNPQNWANLEQWAARQMRDFYDWYTAGLAKAQDNIEKTVATSLMGLDLGQRPLVGHLRTGQIHAVSMLVPPRSEGVGAKVADGLAVKPKLSAIAQSMRLLRQPDPRLPVRAWRSSARQHMRVAEKPRPYLVLFEDQMPFFIEQFGSMVARAMPRHRPADTTGRVGFKLSIPDVTEWIGTHPEIAGLFADIVATYTVRGRLKPDFHVDHETPPDHARFARVLQTSIRYFILSHEYAHILLGHLDTAAPRKGILPVTDAEALKYSWEQELEADSIGMMLSLNACIDYAKLDHPTAFMGIGLYLDALDVMDRAVALLETGDENLRQIGSHPPAAQRKRGVRRSLSMMVEAGEGDPSYPAEAMRSALEMEQIQGEIIRLLWERTRPVLLDLRRRGTRASPTWRIVPKETDDRPAPAQDGAPGTTTPSRPTEATFLVTHVWDLPGRDGLTTSGKTLTGKVKTGMTLQNDAGHKTRVLALEFLSPRDIAAGEVTILLERTDPSPVQPQALLTATSPPA